MTEWREFKIKDIGTVITGTTPSSKIPEYFGTDIPFVTPTDFKYYFKYCDRTDRFLSKIGADKYKNRLLPPQSVLVTCIGSDMGKVAISKEVVITNQQINSIIVSSEFSSDFVYYSLIAIYDTLRTYGQSGTAVPIVNKTDFENITLLIPPLPEQKAIAEVLSSLDDKIDLLTRQNKTLEDLAQTYFRKWFVEDASEDWDVVPISSKYNILLGGTPSRKIESYWKNGTVGWINSGKVNDFRILEASEFITEEALQKSAAKLLPAGTTVIAITGATLGQISIIEYSFAANQSVIGLVPKAELSNNFIYLWLKENLDALVSRQTGGAQQHINSDDVKSFEVVVPNSKMVNLFSIVIDPMMEKISRNCFQILILQKLRDTLLPKLISGEVRVKQ